LRISPGEDESGRAGGGLKLKDARTSVQINTRAKEMIVDRMVPVASNSGRGEIKTNRMAAITAASSPFFNHVGTAKF
jgi:hypothetical protein